MDSQLQNLLEELYAVDPALKAKEKELKRIIEILLKSKPNIVLDESFKEQLRSELSRRSPKTSIFSFLTNTNQMKKFNLVFGSALCLLLVVGAVFVQKNRTEQTKFASVEGKITRLADNAFGDLGQQATMGLGGTGGPVAVPVPQTTTENQSRAAATEPAMGLAPANDVAMGNGGGATSKLMIYQPTTYKYVYKGKDIEIPSEKLEVLKKSKNPVFSPTLNNVLKGMNFGAIDLKGFGNLSIDTFTLTDPNNYSLTVNAREGNMYIYKQYNPVNYVTAPEPIRMPDVLPDDQMISIANQFVKDHKINLKNYGQPEIMDNWQIRYAAMSTEEKANFYIPDQGTVLYPALVNGINIYDQGGNKYGLMVTVSFRDKQVTGLSELTFTGYESSLYQTETDTSRIMALVEKGGLDTYTPMESTNTVEVELGTPSIQLMRYWNYNNGDSSELYVPAIVFPIVNAPKDANFYQKAVVVPIIKQILDSHQPPMYKIMDGQPAPAGNAGSGTAVPDIAPAPTGIMPNKR